MCSLRQLRHPQVSRGQTVAGRRQRFQPYFTPTSLSWLNLVNPRFGLITSQAIRRRRFDSIARVEHAIPRFLANWNDRAQPFRWTKPLIKSYAASVMLPLS
jgi:hypothetical protein